ncbi:MAG TPA: A24 family peptidase [Anaerolineales bacterium]|nr:A24 family peptidase [Anaerolineales bacterium]
MVLILGILALAAGAGINILADDLPARRRLSGPHCRYCGAPRPPLGWSAIVSFFARADRCAYCASRRGFRPLIVELASVGLALWLFVRNPDPNVFIPALLVGLIFLLIAVVDIEHRLILRVVVAPAAVLFLVLGSIQPARGPLKTVLGGIAGFVILWLMYLLGILIARWIARRRGQALEEVAFGFGDVMLGGLLGLVVGWPGILIAIVLGVLAAGIFSIGYIGVMLLRRRYTPYMPIPYGPFLLIGASVVYFGGRTALERLMG